MRLIYLFILGLALSLASGAKAERKVVIELFTSQGCVACAPAHEILEKLSQDPRVIPLAFHVDYWDYLGWPDSFAKNEFTLRQLGYVQKSGSSARFTPHFVINGQDMMLSADLFRIQDLVAFHLGPQNSQENISLKISGSFDSLFLEARANWAFNIPVVVFAAMVDREESRHILGGENMGQYLRFSNIVKDLWEVADWSGAFPLSAELGALEADSLVVFVQERGSGAILASTRFPVP